MCEGNDNYDVFNVIANRQSIRQYEDKDVEEEKLNQILHAARIAPSAKNMKD